MSSYEVDSAQVAQASQRVATSRSTISGETAAMVLHLRDLEQVWKGSAAAGFAGVLAEWDAARLQLETALESIGGALANASTIYADAEADAGRMFQR
ncbi:WXG100 family type VII secretion target [Sanguibacter sp. A247]|uniref:WXG100 family type VII secretion target n=1 Tax=unclassified Sanguibacter TaxID=2645534 RepID=UPI003FD73C62